MKIKTSELQGAALDWAVAKCEEVDMQSFLWAENQRAMDGGLHYYNYSTNWISGGPIIERERINIKENGYGWWFAKIGTNKKDKWVRSEVSPLIAAMRCFVASRLGDEVNIPEELKA